MRTLYSVLLMLVCGILGSTPSFAQNSQGYASELSKQIKESLDMYDDIFGKPGSISDAKLKAFCKPFEPSLRERCFQKAEDVTKLYRNAMTLLKDQPEKVDALPRVYQEYYKGARMADMTVTDQIGKASFQFTFVAFLMWYIQQYPLPTVGNVPMQVVPGQPGADSQSGVGRNCCPGCCN